MHNSKRSIFSHPYIGLALSILTLASSLAIAQSAGTQNPQTSVYKDVPFSTLVSQRDALQADIAKLTNEVNLFGDLRAAVQQQNGAKTSNQREVAESKITELASYLGLDPEKAKTMNLADAKKPRQDKLDDETKLKEAIEAEMSQRIDVQKPKQAFKTDVSIIFAIIVGLVIVGFFVIALKNEKVGQEIFAGQQGIQFITLFSLVIAIILFGITEILEGKELSALLGGLAGYILGRSGTTGAPERRQIGPQTEVIGEERITAEEPRVNRAVA